MHEQLCPLTTKNVIDYRECAFCEIIRNIREEIRIDVQAILDHGFTSGMEKAAQIVREYRQARETYAKESEGGYMKGLRRAEMLIMDVGHGAS